MASLARRRGGAHYDFTWPGYVDALASLLMVLIFLLAFYSIAQFVLTDAITGRDNAIERLNREVAGLADLLSVERDRSRKLDSDLAGLTLQLSTVTAERERLAGELADANRTLAGVTAERDRATRELAGASAERDRANRDLAEVRKALTAADAERERINRQLADAARALQLSNEERDRLADEARRRGADAEKLALERDRLTARIAAMLVERDELAAALRGAEAKAGEAARAASKSAEELKAEVERQRLELTRLAASLAVANNERGKAFADLTEEQKLTAEQKAAIVRLTAEINALKQELARLGLALDAADAKAKEQQVQIADLGQRLNRALAARVEELAKYKSEFFGRLRQALAGRRDITIVGDRFVFQSEVLFETNSSDLQPEGQRQLADLAERLRDIIKLIPSEIDWVLQVEGHTDARPIRTPRFPSNWELSTARAVTVVKFLAAQGIPSERLAAAGYGEFHPLVPGDDPASRAKNRRIEIKLTGQ